MGLRCIPHLVVILRKRRQPYSLQVLVGCIVFSTSVRHKVCAINSRFNICLAFTPRVAVTVAVAVKSEEEEGVAGSCVAPVDTVRSVCLYQSSSKEFLCSNVKISGCGF